MKDCKIKYNLNITGLITEKALNDINQWRNNYEEKIKF